MKNRLLIELHSGEREKCNFGGKDHNADVFKYFSQEIGNLQSLQTSFFGEKN